MKKFLVGLSLVVVAIVSFSSCRKIVDKIFNGIDIKAPDISIPVPTILLIPPGEMTLGTVNMHFNLDSAIRANTSNVFGIDDVRSIKVKQYVVTIPEADQNNNLSNFESGRVTLTSNSNGTPVTVANFSLPDVAANNTTIPVTESPELISYLRGNQLSYTIYGKARKTTTKPLTLVVSVTVAVR